MIDSHSHVYAEEFDVDRTEVLLRAKEAGVSKILLPNIDIYSIDALNALCEANAGFIYKMMGLHPCSVSADYQQQLELIKVELDKDDSIAVGEIGIDLFWDTTTKEIQIAAFKIQCEWAIEKDLPIVIHSRESIDLIIDIIETNYAGRIRGVFHCFTGTLEQAKRILALGMFLGIGGVLTFKNSDLRNVLAHIPIQSLLIETDAPYLAPVPHRGKRNEPAYIKLVQEHLSAIYSLPYAEIDSIIEGNSLRLFRI